MATFKETCVLDSITKMSFESKLPCVRFTDISRECNLHQATTARILKRMIKLKEIYKCPQGGYMKVWPNEPNFIESRLVITPIEVLKNNNMFVAEISFKGTLLNNTYKKISRLFIDIYGDILNNILELKIDNNTYKINLMKYKLSENLFTYIHVLHIPINPGSILSYEYKFYLGFSGDKDIFSFKVLSPTIKFKFILIKTYEEISIGSIKFAGFQPLTILKMYKKSYKGIKRYLAEILYVPKFSLIDITFNFNL